MIRHFLTAVFMAIAIFSAIGFLGLLFGFAGFGFWTVWNFILQGEFLTYSGETMERGAVAMVALFIQTLLAIVVAFIFDPEDGYFA